MFKHLTLAFFAGTLFTGCVLTTGDTTDTLSDTSVNPPETGDTTADVLTGGTTAEPATESAEGDTTANVPTTGTPGDTGDTGDTGGTTTNDPTATTGGAPYGNCGWKEDTVSFYACVDEGGVAGAEDPLGENPILCADGLVAGDPCSDENGPVGGVGCCTAEGVLYFCDFTDPDMPVIYEQDCG